MGRVKLHLVRYMGTYTILMFVSFLLLSLYTHLTLPTNREV